MLQTRLQKIAGLQEIKKDRIMKISDEMMKFDDIGSAPNNSL